MAKDTAEGYNYEDLTKEGSGSPHESEMFSARETWLTCNESQHSCSSRPCKRYKQQDTSMENPNKEIESDNNHSEDTMVVWLAKGETNSKTNSSYNSSDYKGDSATYPDMEEPSVTRSETMKAITSILMKTEANNVGAQQPPPMRPWSTFDEERQNKSYRQFWTAQGTDLLSNAEDSSVKKH